MSQRTRFKTQEERERGYNLWGEEIRRKAIQVIKAYQVTPAVERIWREARRLFHFSLPGRTRGLLFHSVLLPPQDNKVTIAVSTTPALRRLKPLLAQITKDLKLLLGNHLQVSLASFESLLGEAIGNQRPTTL